MTAVIRHNDGSVHIDELGDGRRRISVRLADPRTLSPRLAWVTSYGVELIRRILAVKGPARLCDEIAREEDPSYVESDLRACLLCYRPADEFENRKILDFGCGSGASTIILSRMFPKSQVVGVELQGGLLEIANARCRHYGADHVAFVAAPSADQLPGELGAFDYVVLCAVYEHLLPNERRSLMLQLWDHLAEGGTMFIVQTPDRRFPIETHTTGLPLLNYVPDGAAHFLARRFSRRVARDATWPALLRGGIRGATCREIAKVLGRSSHRPVFLTPAGPKVRRQSDIWYGSSRVRLSKRFTGLKKWIILALGSFLLAAGVPVAPYLSLAIEKSPGEGGR